MALGGAALVPEDAQNISAGFTTNFIDNLNLSVDYYGVDVTNKIIKSRSLPVEGGTEFSELAFYTNALDKNIWIRYCSNLRLSGGTNIACAINTNTTEVVSQNQVNGLNPVSDGTVFNLENNLPQLKMSASVNHSFSDALALMIRMNHYGETVDERGGMEKVDPAQLIDVELNYTISENLSVVFGANNALNTYPTEIETRLSQGMPYPRRTPIGYHGGMVFTRLTYNF